MVRKTKSGYTVRFPEDRDAQVKEAAARKGLSVPNYIVMSILEIIETEQ
jgi:hypothetical protein